MNIAACIPLFSKCNSFVLTTHLNPDGDGLGSQIALRDYLLAAGKKVHCINNSPTPHHYKFLDPNNDKIDVFDNDTHTKNILEADCIVVIDTNILSRLGDMAESICRSRAVKIVIDHHLDKTDFADHYIVDEDAAATGEIVYRLLDEIMQNKLTDTIAVGLYTAIMTDTGSYRFPKTDRNTHLITAELLKYNVDPSTIYREVYERGPINRLVLLGKSLSTLRLHHQNRVATMKVTKEMLKDTDTDLVETDGFVNYTMQIDNVSIGLLFTENENKIKISFRARGDVRVNELAKEFNGNGHQHAAGATIPDGNLDGLLIQVIEAASKYLP